MLSIGGFLLQSTLPVNVTFGQMIAPISAATVSSLMMGFAWGTGGLSVPFVGMLADRIGIESALVVMAFMPLLAALWRCRFLRETIMPIPRGGRGTRGGPGQMLLHSRQLEQTDHNALPLSPSSSFAYSFGPGR